MKEEVEDDAMMKVGQWYICPRYHSLAYPIDYLIDLL